MDTVNDREHHRDPRMLAQLARGGARRKISELEQALEGAEFFTDYHAGLLTTMLARIDQIDAEVTRLSQVIVFSFSRSS